MTKLIVLGVLVILGLVAVWLLAGRQFVLLVDVFATARAESLPAGPLIYSPNTLTVGDYLLETTLLDGQPAAFRIDVDAKGRLTARARGNAFPLGTRIGPPDRSGRPDIAFAPDPDDEVSFTEAPSLLSWPTPLDFNFMTGQSPQWRRNLYFRLAWHKRSGAMLNMVWRYEQWFYDGSGWSGYMTHEGATGLVDVHIEEVADH